MLWFLGLTYCAIMLFANHVSSVINQVRYFMPLLPLFWLLGGIACASLRRRRVIVFFILFVWCLADYIAEPAFRKSLYIPDEYTLLHVAFPIDEIIQDIRSESTPSDAIAFEFPFRNWVMQGIIGYYMKGASTRYVLTEALGNNEEPQKRFDEFNHFLGAAGRVYFVVDRTIVSSGFLEQYESILSARYVRCGRLWDTEQATVDKYARVQALCEPPAEPLIEYQSPLALLEFRQEQTAKGHFLYSTWSADLPADTYSLSLRIWDSARELNYQLDDALPLGEFNYRIDHIPLESLPLDRKFRVEAAVYDWRTGDRLRAADGADIVTVYKSNA